VSEDQRQRILRDWHIEGSYLSRLWESLEVAREARGHAVQIVNKSCQEELA
jgi:hypothetical protein